MVLLLHVLARVLAFSCSCFCQNFRRAQSRAVAVIKVGKSLRTESNGHYCEAYEMDISEARSPKVSSVSLLGRKGLGNCVNIN